MALTDLLFRRFNPTIWKASSLEPLVWLTLDATIRETHSVRAQATRHPVEEGADISDHVHHEPDELSLEGIVSNTPCEPFLLLDPDPTRAQTAYDVLLDLIGKGTPVKIVTSLRSYDNMILEDLSVPRDVANKYNLEFSLTARSIRTVATKTVAAPNPIPERGKATQNRGRVGTKPASAPTTQSGSAALQLLGG